MRLKSLILAFSIGSLLIVAAVGQLSMAQEENYILSHDDVFGNLRRPPVDFAHEKHAESLADDGCGRCHHTPNAETGRLVYIEGEELSCKECHGSHKEDNIPALREAFHGSCTGCHRHQIKSGNPKSGPTTCGGCHRKT